MKKALLYVTVASAATLGFALLFFTVTGIIPVLAARINYEALVPQSAPSGCLASFPRLSYSASSNN